MCLTRSPAFKDRVALAAAMGDKTLAESAQQFDIHPNQITTWKNRLMEGADGVAGHVDRSMNRAGLAGCHFV